MPIELTRNAETGDQVQIISAVPDDNDGEYNLYHFDLGQRFTVPNGSNVDAKLRAAGFEYMKRESNRSGSYELWRRHRGLDAPAGITGLESTGDDLPVTPTSPLPSTPDALAAQTLPNGAPALNACMNCGTDLAIYNFRSEMTGKVKTCKIFICRNPICSFSYIETNRG